MTDSMPPWAELQAPAHWSTVEFLSDLHLHEGDPATLARWQHYLRTSTADAIFMLGDVFEVWVGDDAAHQPAVGTLASFEAQCSAFLQTLDPQRPLYFMAGNRDFLVGAEFLADCGITALQDPTVFAFSGHRFLLTHGDALCLADSEYLKFRQQVRSPAWQRAFLEQGLDQRRAAAQHMRQQSELHKQTSPNYADVDAEAARHWLALTQSNIMIHGHTHRPACHQLGNGCQRWVLSDWDCAAHPPRAEVLRLRLSASDPKQIQALRLAPQHASLDTTRAQAMKR